VVVYAKDSRREDKKIGDLPVGTSILNYPALLKLLDDKRSGIDILLENSKPVITQGTMAFPSGKLRSRTDSKDRLSGD
jgi:hypothetical protein